MEKNYVVEKTMGRHGSADPPSVEKDFPELSGSPVHGLQLVEIVEIPCAPAGCKPTVHDVETRAIAAIRRLADGQGDPHLAAAIARYIPRPAGRPKATQATPAARRNAILRRVRKLLPYAELSDVSAATAMHRDFARWVRFHDPLAAQPFASPMAQWFELHALGMTSLPKIKTIQNAFALH